MGQYLTERGGRLYEPMLYPSYYRHSGEDMDKKFMNVLGLIGVAAWILYFIWKSGSYTNKELTEAYITLASMTPLYFILTNLYSRFDKLVLWSLLCLGILSSGIAVYFHVHS